MQPDDTVVERVVLDSGGRYPVGACPLCGAYRIDGRPPLLHVDGCLARPPIDEQVEEWWANQW